MEAGKNDGRMMGVGTAREPSDRIFKEGKGGNGITSTRVRMANRAVGEQVVPGRTDRKLLFGARPILDAARVIYELASRNVRQE